MSLIETQIFSRPARQTLFLYSSQILGMLLGIITITLNTRILGPEKYGIFSFFMTIVGFGLLFFRFGFFSSGGVLLAHEYDQNRKNQLIGALTFACLLIGISFALFLFAFSFFLDGIFNANIGNLLRLFSPLLVLLPFQLLIPQIAQGINKIGALSLFTIVPRSLYVIFVVTIYIFIESNLDVKVLVFLNLLAVTIAVIVTINRLNASFANLRRNLLEIWGKNKEYGIHLYWGQVVTQSTYKLDGIFISYFVNTTQLGYYTIANALILPMVMLPESFSISLFRDFAKKEKIPRKLLYFNFFWLSFSVIGLTLLGRSIVMLLFSDKFLPVVPLILPFALSGLFMGLKQPYNIFLGAHGEGVFKRNIASIVAATNLLGNATLIPIWGIWGAVLATLFGQTTAYAMHVLYYRKALAEEKSSRGVGCDIGSK